MIGEGKYLPLTKYYAKFRTWSANLEVVDIIGRIKLVARRMAKYRIPFYSLLILF